MSELAIGWGTRADFARLGSSPEHEKVWRMVFQADLRLKMRADQSAAQDALEELRSDAALENQRGNIIATLGEDSYVVARQFLFSLPVSLPAPAIGIDPDGEVSFDWVDERGRNFSVSLGENGRLSYAGQFSLSSSIHGTEEFDDSVPEIVLASIRRLVSSRN